MFGNKGKISNSVEAQWAQQQSQDSQFFTAHQGTNSGRVGDNPIKAKPADPENSLEQEIRLLKKSVKSLKRENRIGLGSVAAVGLAGTLIAANWSTVAPVLVNVAAATATVAGATVIGSIVALGIALFCVYKAFEHRAKIKEGAGKAFGYVAEKTVEGAKSLRGKAVNGYNNSVDSLKRGASRVAKSGSVTLDRMSGKTNYLDKLDNFNDEEKGKYREIKAQFKEIFDNVENHSQLVENILSGIASKIDSEIAKNTYGDFRDYLPNEKMVRLEEQTKFIKDFSAGNLCSFFTEKPSAKNTYFINSIFSEHHGDIKQVIEECKEEHTRFSTIERLNKVGGAYGTSKRGSTSSLTKSDSVDSISTSGSEDSDTTVGSIAELLNTQEREQAKSKPWYSLSRLGRSAKETSNSGYQALSQPSEKRYSTVGADRNPSKTRASTRVSPPTVPKMVDDDAIIAGAMGQLLGNSIPVAPPKPPRAFTTRSDSVGSLDSNTTLSSATSSFGNFEAPTPQAQSFAGRNKADKQHSNSSLSTDSGVNSPSSSPSLVMFTQEDGTIKQQSSLRKTGSLGQLISQKPSSNMEINVTTLHSVEGLTVK